MGHKETGPPLFESETQTRQETEQDVERPRGKEKRCKTDGVGETDTEKWGKGRNAKERLRKMRGMKTNKGLQTARGRGGEWGMGSRAGQGVGVGLVSAPS